MRGKAWHIMQVRNTTYDSIFAVLATYSVLSILKHHTVLEKIGHYVGQYCLFLLIIF